MSTNQVLHSYTRSRQYSESAAGDGRRGVELGLSNCSWNRGRLHTDDGRHADPADRRGALLRHLVDPLGAGRLSDTGSPSSPHASLARASAGGSREGFVQNSVCSTLGNLEGKLPQELIDERTRSCLGVGGSTGRAADQARHLSATSSTIAWLADLLGDGETCSPRREVPACHITTRSARSRAKRTGSEITELVVVLSVVGMSAMASRSRRRPTRRSRPLGSGEPPPESGRPWRTPRRTTSGCGGGLR